MVTCRPAFDFGRHDHTRAQVAATPMDGWGASGSRYLRLVFANEPLAVTPVV